MRRTQLDLVASIALATVCAWMLGVIAGWLHHHAGLAGWLWGALGLVVLIGLAVSAALFALVIRDELLARRKRRG